MSINAVEAVLKHSKHSGTAKLVMVCIANHYNDTSRAAWPSIDTLAGYCNVSTTSIHNALKSLKNSGELIIDYKSGPHGCNLYRFYLPDITDNYVEPPSSQLDSQASLTVKPASGTPSSQLDSTLKPALPKPLLTVNEPLNIITTTAHGQLATFYQEKTGQAPKGVTDAQRWEDDCLQIIDLAGGNVEAARLLMSEAIIILDDLKYTYKEPGSLITTITRQLQRANQKRNGGRNNGYVNGKQQSGGIAPPQQQREKSGGAADRAKAIAQRSR